MKRADKVTISDFKNGVFPVIGMTQYELESVLKNRHRLIFTGKEDERDELTFLEFITSVRIT